MRAKNFSAVWCWLLLVGVGFFFGPIANAQTSSQKEFSLAGKVNFTFIQVESRMTPADAPRGESLEAGLLGFYRGSLWGSGLRMEFRFPLPGKAVGREGRLVFTIKRLREDINAQIYNVSKEEIEGSYAELRGNLIGVQGEIEEGQLVVERLLAEKDSLYRLQASFWFRVEGADGVSRLFRMGRLLLDAKLPVSGDVVGGVPVPKDRAGKGTTEPTPVRKPTGSPRLASGCGGGVDIDLPSDAIEPDSSGCGGGDPILDGEPSSGDDCGGGDPILDGSDSGCGDSGGDGCDGDTLQRNKKHAVLRSDRRWRRQWGSFVQFGIPFLWIVFMRLRRRRGGED